MSYGYWRHSVTHEIWACETANGLPLRCAGPFSNQTADEIFLPYLDYSSRDIAPVQAEWRLFAPYVRCRVCGKSIDAGDAAAAPQTTIHAACAPRA
jgi:hypothetical protein